MEPFCGNRYCTESSVPFILDAARYLVVIPLPIRLLRDEMRGPKQGHPPQTVAKHHVRDGLGRA